MLHLNDCMRNTNPEFGSHDPSMMYDPISGKYYSYSTDVFMPSCGLNDKIGIPVRVSEDLVNFRYIGTVLSPNAIREARDNGEHSPTEGFWAPFAEYVNGEYRLYYSATKAFGSWESRIWLAVSERPEGPFENRGVVVDTWNTPYTSPNGIDPHIIWAENIPYLVYGSFFGGIYLKELETQIGLSAGSVTDRGVCISRKPTGQKLDGPEGASVIYHSETGFYYLFQSYGWLGDTYDIRVGRSRNVKGPYVDISGRSLVGESPGIKLANSYCFVSKHPEVMEHPEKADAGCAGKDNEEAECHSGWKWAGFRGPGHGVPFYDPVSGEYYFVHHIRDGAEIYRQYDRIEERNNYRMHYLMVRRMYFTKDGWPVFSPEPFTGTEERVERSVKIPARQERLWEIIFFDDNGNEQKKSEFVTLDRDSVLLSRGILISGWDFENGKEALLLSGIDELGVAYWGKYR